MITALIAAGSTAFGIFLISLIVLLVAPPITMRHESIFVGLTITAFVVFFMSFMAATVIDANPASQSVHDAVSRST